MRNFYAVVLFALLLLFCVVGFRGVLGDLQLIFDRRLLHKGTRFTLRQLLIFVFASALICSVLRALGVPLLNPFALFCAAVFFGLALLTWIAIMDICEKHRRRRYSEKLPSDFPGDRQARDGEEHSRSRPAE